MKLRVVSVCFNERAMLPFYLRHYEQFADEIVLYDDDSTDGTQALALCCDRVTLRSCPFKGLVDDKMMELWQASLREAELLHFDWIAFPDIDEFLWHPVSLLNACLMADRKGYQVVASNGWNMTGDGLPADDGKSQIYDLHQSGVRAPVYSKAILVKVGTKVNWNRGRHAVENSNVRVSPPLVKLLHYRYLGHAYTAKRNARNYDRVGADKGCAWSNAPDYHGEHSAKWAEFAKTKALNALNEPI